MASLLQHANQCLPDHEKPLQICYTTFEDTFTTLNFEFPCPFLLYIHPKIGRLQVTHDHAH